VSLIFHEGDAPPPNFRGKRGSADIYIAHGDHLSTLEKLPPVWTLRGYLERGPYPIHRMVYDLGEFIVPTTPEGKAAFERESAALHKPFNPYILGIRLLVDDCLVYVNLASHPEHRGEGHMSRFLDALPTNQTVIFPEVLPESRMPGMLQRRGFEVMFVADDDDELRVFFPCYVRWKQ
jgi:hypothetical protein